MNTEINISLRGYEMVRKLIIISISIMAVLAFPTICVGSEYSQKNSENDQSTRTQSLVEELVQSNNYPNAYNSVDEYWNEYPGDIMEDLKNGYTIVFSMNKGNYDIFDKTYKEKMDIMEEVAKHLGAEEKDGSYLNRHRGTTTSFTSTSQYDCIVGDDKFLICLKRKDGIDLWFVELSSIPFEMKSIHADIGNARCRLWCLLPSKPRDIWTE